MKLAMHWKKLNEIVRCELCPRYCAIKDGERGNCGARENKNGKLYSLVYGRPCSLAVDPIEKKPLFHFLPGSNALSIATTGCNFHCLFCQNWEISQAKFEDVPSLDMAPEEVVKEAKRNFCKSISYTYTEPTIFYEYMLDIAKIARKEKIKNNTVTNGFINPAPLKELCKYLDASNIDFKGNDEYYKKLCGAWLSPIEESIKIMFKAGVWVELTNLIIPGYNDKEEDIKLIINWIKENLGKDVPLHFTAFYPAYKMLKTPSTNPALLKKARKMAMDAGLNYVYTGNIYDEEGSTTYCPKCKKALIKRSGFFVSSNYIEKGKCKFCKKEIAGVWE